MGYGVNNFGYHLLDYENHKIIRVAIWHLMRMWSTNISCKEENKKRKNIEYTILDEIREFFFPKSSDKYYYQKTQVG